MNVTREEAIEILQEEHDWCQEPSYVIKAIEKAIAALRPVSREQVEKVWRGEWEFPIFVDQKGADDPRCQCSECGSIETPLARHRFCPSCGAPMTDEAVQMVTERMEALYGDG